MTKMTYRQLEVMAWMHAKGMSQRSIADSAGVSRGTLCYWMKRRPDMFPPREKRDEVWWRKKLAAVDGLSASDAARRLGCHRHTVWKWRRRLHDAR